MNKVTVSRSILIAAPPEKVWDYTQNWNRRREWDRSVVEVLAQSEQPQKQVRARFQGGLVFDIQYKLNERPRKTSLAMTNSTSRWIVGGGGSWRYDVKNDHTEWVQTNTLVLADHFLMRLLRPLFALSLLWSTAKAMKRAKAIIETGKTVDLALLNQDGKCSV